MDYLQETKQRYYYSERSGKNLLDEIYEYLELKNWGHSDLKFIYLFNEEDLLDENISEKVKNVLSVLTKEIDLKDIIISFDHQLKDNLNSNQTCQNLLKLTQEFSSVNLGIEAEFRTWNINEIISTNNKLDKIVEEIKEKNYSCVEALMHAYMFVTNHLYIDSKNDSSVPRTIYGVLNSDQIVCVGYCELLKEIMNRLHYKDLKIFSNNVEAVIINEVCNKHRNLIIYLKDEKYNLEGYYYFDPTWDAKRQDEEYKFNFFMLPIEEIKNINEYKIYTENVKFSGTEEKTSHENFLSYYNRPETNNKVSIGSSSAKICEEFYNFIKNDKNLFNDFEKIKKSNKDIDSIIKNNFNEFLPAIIKQTKKLDFKTFYKILYNVLKKSSNLTEHKQKLKLESILKYNINISKNYFDNNANTVFKASKTEQEYELNK